jgi:hypothetical protein
MDTTGLQCPMEKKMPPSMKSSAKIAVRKVARKLAHLRLDRLSTSPAQAGGTGAYTDLFASETSDRVRGVVANV